MRTAIILFGYAVGAGLVTRLLRRPWVVRAPRLAVALWQLTTTTIVLAGTLGLLVLAVPEASSRGLAGLLHACVMALSNAYRAPTNDRLVFLVSLGLVLSLAARLAASLALELWRAARERRTHLDALTLVGRPDSTLGVTLIDHAAPAAYCIPGRRQRIVLTSAALSALDEEQLAEVLVHERAHLAGRHDLVVVWARALARAFPLPVFRAAAAELAILVEMLADDAVQGTRQRLNLATALVSLASGEHQAVPASTLGAACSDVTARVRRLIRPCQPLSRPASLLLMALAVAAAATPLVIAAAPAAAAAALPFCSLPPG